MRVGLIVSGTRAPAWQHDIVDRTRALPGVHLVVATAAERRAGTGWARLVRHAPALQPRAIAADPQQACDLAIDLDGRGEGEPAIRARQLWMLADRAGRPLAAEFPAIDDICAGRGAEVVVRDARDSSAPPVRRARFACGSWYAGAFARIYSEAVHLVAAAVREMQATGLPSRPAPQGAPPVRETSPRVSFSPFQSPVLLRLAEGACRAAARRLASMMREESWMIGLIDQPIGVVATRAEAPAVRWLGSRSLSRYLADPFGVPGTRDRIYCESFSASDGSGAIEELRIDADAIEEQTPVALPIPGHLSYPYLFQHEGVLHCVPESVATRQTRILRSEANGAWSTLTVALPRVAAADPTLFWWRDRFWLAYTDADRGGFDNLNLAFSERLAGPWFPHPNNPVKVDAASSRPAGTPFLHEGALYRPAQDCSVTYGGGIAVNRVSVCSPTAFCEETVRVLRPSTDDLNPDGWHTLSAWGDRTLIDGKRYTVNPFVLRRKVRRRLARLGSGLARGLSW